MDINLTEFHFIRPYWLLAFIPAIVMIVLLLKNKLQQGNWSTVCDPELLPFLLQERAVHQSRWALSISAVCALLTIFALAGPTWERLPSPVFRNDAALVIALDLSRSMDAADIKPSRLSRARYKIADILKHRKDGQTALLVYAGDTFTVTPLTEDTETIASQISALTTEIMPSQGSNTVIAIENAIKLLKQAGLQSGEILLVTDGVDFENTLDAVESLAGYHLSILGVGTAEGAPIKTAKGGFIKDAQGNIVVPKLNVNQLTQIANEGKGVYQTISSSDNDIEGLLNQFDHPTQIEANDDNSLLIDQWNEKGPWLLLLVLPLAALGFRRGLFILALFTLIPFPTPSYAMEWNDLWQSQNQQAEQRFKQQQYQQAAEQFDDSQWKAAAQYKAGQFEQAAEVLQNELSATGLYNLGNALAKAGKLPEAVDAYKQSLQINPENTDAIYNKEQVEKALEKQQDQQQGDDQKKSEQQDSEQGDDENDQQGENSEQSEQQSDSEQQNSEQSEQQQSEENAEEKEAAEQAKQSEQEQQDAEEKESQQLDESSEMDETKQANEQWLKRIPDDPAGLLKRKFKYQYGQRARKTTNNQQGW